MRKDAAPLLPQKGSTPRRLTHPSNNSLPSSTLRHTCTALHKGPDASAAVIACMLGAAPSSNAQTDALRPGATSL
jgi:hypothetical protein